MNDDLLRRKTAWTHYWSTGAAHSCGTSYGNVYGGTIAAFWRKIHDATPAGSKLLDVATGSGAIPRLWRTWRTSDTWEAVDLAATTPEWASQGGARLRFHPGVQAEALPFEAASFDLITSQYGLEYCDIALVMQEVLRVRAPKGSVALVIHHDQSRPVSLARAELSHLQWALGPDGLITACAEILGHVADARTPNGRKRLMGDPAAEAARQRFNAAQLALRDRLGAGDGGDVLCEIRDRTAGILDSAMRHGASSARSQLESWYRELSDHRWRTQELCTHALSATSVQDLAGLLKSYGLRTETGTLAEGPYLMAWTLRGMAH